MSIIKPTIGRKVWFWPAGFLGVKTMSSLQACDATIVFVWSDSMVNLLVTDHGGTSMAITSVHLRQGDEPSPTGCYAEWMPFQLGQAMPAGRTPNLDESLFQRCTPYAPPFSVGDQIPPRNVVTCTQASVDPSLMQPDTTQIKAY